MALFISMCNWLSRTEKIRAITEVHGVSDLIEQMRAGGREQQSWWLSFEHNWNVTVFTMESRNQISSWFAHYGVEMNFNTSHRGDHRNRTELRCHTEDIVGEQLEFLQQWMSVDVSSYEAVRDNGGSLKIRHHSQWMLFLQKQCKEGILRSKL